MKSLGRTIVGCLSLVITIALAQPAAASAEGKKALDELIAQAKKEGDLTTQVVRQAGRTVPKLMKAFKKRFGLDNLKTHIAKGGQSRAYAQLFATLGAGGKPPYDTYPGAGDNVIELMHAGHAQKIANWRLLLAEINPLVRSGKVKPEEVSPSPFTGYGFSFAGRNKVLIYNPKLISLKDLPKSRSDMANPKHKGNFALGSFTSEWELGTLVYDKDEWLKTLDKIGKNAAGVMHTTQAKNRLLLGEFAFYPGNFYHYLSAKAKDSEAPIGYRWFSDGTATTQIFYIIPKDSRHPAVGTLFSMWIGTPEAEGIWQPPSFYTNVHWGQSDYDKMARKTLKESGSKLLSFYDSPESLEVLKWFGTDEGKAYRRSITRKIRQRR